MEQLKNFIAGEFSPALSGKWIPVFNPSTAEHYCDLPDSDEKDVEKAVIAAEKAFPGWSGTPARDRAKILREIAFKIEAQKQVLAHAESVDNGKPFQVAFGLDIPRSASNFEFFADAITQFSSEAHATDQQAINYTLRTPLGIVGCISPWNLPLYLFTWKIAPALAAGNCVIAKPSEVTPMTAYLLSKICIEAGLPPGVLNIVHGYGHKVGAVFSRHPKISAVSFTGSTRTGAEIAKTAAPLFKKISLEMGGKNPSIIFADANFEEALATTVRSAFSNQGQICLCGSRIFIERPIYERFKKALIEKTKALKVGDPLDLFTEQGAVVSREHFEKVMSWIEVAKKEGGQILTGGAPAKLDGRCKKGWFIQPTLIEGLPAHCSTNQEEIFGPVATLIPFDQEDECVEWANSTQYGLAANLWTQDISRAHRVAGKIKSGIVWVNCWMLRDLRTPFGGMKDSGVGREGGWEALRFFTETKNVCVKF